MTKLIRSLTVFLFFVLTVILNWNCSDTNSNLPQNIGVNQQIDGGDVPVCTANMQVFQNVNDVSVQPLDRSFSIYTWMGTGAESDIESTITNAGQSTFDVYIKLTWSNATQDYWYGVYYVNGSPVGTLNANIGSGTIDHMYYNVSGISQNSEFTHKLMITPIFDEDKH